VAETIGNWGFARLFAEVVDKTHFDPTRSPSPLDAWAFEQVVSRFETYLQNMDSHNEEQPQQVYGLLIHDNNQTIAKKHTELMRGFHFRGTLWTAIKHIIETPLFVDSSLTGMVQVSDLCAYALRRYVENHEDEIFDHIFKRADRKGALTVGVRHFSDLACTCKICDSHTPKATATAAPPAPAFPTTPPTH
jgi:hypothetical protein